MKSTISRIIMLISLISTFTLSPFAHAQVPQVINYQGVLYDSNGKLVDDGYYNIQISLYSDESSDYANWTETQSILVINGIFNVLLGSEMPLDIFFDRPYWLGVTVGDDDEATPRILLTPSAYSMVAQSVVDGSINGKSLSPDISITTSETIQAGAFIGDGSQLTGISAGNSFDLPFAGTAESNGSVLTISNSGIGYAIRGNANSTTSVAYGVFGQSSSGTGAGVYGTALSATGLSSGVYGQSASSSGRGVFGVAPLRGVEGFATAETGTTYGIYARSQSSNGFGIYSHATSTTGTTYGIMGRNEAINGSGVYGWARSALGNTSGVYGISASNTGYGVMGYASNISGGTVGVYGWAISSSGGTGVYGLASATTGTTTGIFAEVRSPNGTAFIAQHSSGNYAAIGRNDDSIFAHANRSGSYAIYAVQGLNASRAGYFAGTVTVTGTLSKAGGTFEIDHPLDPENMVLRHSFVESPDMMNVYNGNVTTDGAGFAAVQLPDYFQALNRDFRYQLTVIGEFAQAVVWEEIGGNRFTVRTDKPNVRVSWQVTGVRQDRWALENPMIVEEYKTPETAGYYLHPQAFGQPLSRSVEQARNREQEARIGQFARSDDERLRRLALEIDRLNTELNNNEVDGTQND
jgi:hypothetical protein